MATTAHRLIALLIIAWCCLNSSVEASSTKPVMGVVSTMAADNDDAGSSLYAFQSNYMGEGKHGYWGFFSGGHFGTIYFNDGTKLESLDLAKPYYLCGVRYEASDSPSKKILVKDCIFSPSQLNLDSVTATSRGVFAAASSLDSVSTSQGVTKYAQPGTFIIYFTSDPEALDANIYVKHSKQKDISWNSLGSLDSSNFVAVGVAGCTQDQTPDKAIFSDNSEITFPSGCSIASFAAIFTFTGIFTVEKKQNLYKDGTGGLMVRKLVVTSDKSFWICGNYLGQINFDGITQTTSTGVQTPFFSYYEIDNTKAEPFKFVHYTSITGFESQQADAVDMKIISGEMYVIGNAGPFKQSFLIFYTQSGAGVVQEKKRLVVAGNVLFTGIDSNNDKDNQEILITGYFEKTIQIGSITLVSSGKSDIFIAAINRTTLDVVWAIKEGGAGDDLSFGVKNNDNHFISIYGKIFSTSKFDRKSIPDLIDGASNRFISYLTMPNSCFGIASNDDNVCSAHGVCQNDGTCVCSAGFGDQCEFLTCNGIHFNETNVCNGHGNCINYNNCTCNNGWSGQYCTTSFTCSSIASYDSSVCSGNGVCYAKDKCRCNDGWSGSNCDVYTCFGIAANSATVCNKHGICNSNHTCSCLGDWTGANCSTPICFGFSESLSCSQHGSCISNNTCSCSKGWFGADCSIHSCNGTSSQDAENVCNGGKGQCIEKDLCSCNSTWSGQYCTIPKCFGKNANDTSVCSSRGQCIDVNTCHCSTNWFGSDCSIHSCNGTSAQDLQNVCNGGKGNCVSPDICICNPDWSGPLCTVHNCFGISSDKPSVCNSHGNCTNVNTCHCNSVWFGLDCSIPSCNGTSAQDLQNVCNGRGKCLQMDKCDCKPGWTGQNCETAQCFGLPATDSKVCSSNGDCVSSEKCSCKSGWFGLDCSIHSCNGISALDVVNVCNEGRGQCTDTDKCSCIDTWTGQFCEIPKCFGFNSTDSSVCSGNGKCGNVDTCICDKGWFGINCSIHSCNGTSSQDVENVCNGGKGQCNGKDLCSCNSNWAGQYCTIPKCFGKNANDSSVCSSRGQCVDVNNCQCDTNWFGSDCSIHSCNGTSAQDLQNVCNGGKGQCISADNCSCNSNWAGQFCEIPKCFGLAASEANVCAGNGLCISPDICTCNAKWFGAKCESHSCFGIPFYNVSFTCSSNGQCVAMDTCKCNNGFEGDTCSLHTCDGISSNDSRVCSNGQGQCTDANQCTCIQSESGKTDGPKCEMIYCNVGTDNSWLPYNDPAVCSQHGKCQFNKTNVGCSCDEGFGGQICQYPICYGILSNSNKVCNGAGLCSSPNNCSCFDNDIDGHFTGLYCEKCKTPYSGINCTSIGQCNATLKCNAHGTCDSSSFCTCYQDGTNGYWSGSDCNTCSDEYYGEDCVTRISNPVFNNEGKGLIFKLYAPQYFTSLTVDCNKLLDSSAISSFGSNIVCRYSNKTSNDFIIEFGTDNSIQVNQEILMNRNVFNRNKQGKDYQPFKIGNALNPTLPTISVSQKLTYTSCENVLLDASESYSTDGKELSYKWEIINSNILSLTSNNSSKLSITYDNLNAGSHTFKLTVTSQVLKASSVKQVSFQKLNYATPVISIDGSNSISLSTNSLPLIVRKAITLPSCLPSNSEIVVKWEYLSGTGIDYQVDSYYNLKIVKFNDLTQLTHQFKVSSFIKGKEDQVSSANLNIQLSVSPLVVNLLKVESTINQVTIEIEEIDSDLQTIPFERSWQTNNLNNNANLLQYLSTIKNNSLIITKSLVNSASQFDLSLTSSKVSRSATSTLSIIFPESPAQIPPTITLANSPLSKLNKGTLLSVQFIVSSSSNNIKREWTMDNKIIPSELTSNMRMTLSESNELVLDTSTLTEGSTYQISFKVTNTDSSLSDSSSLSFTINKSPKPCDCQVSPLTGIAMTTLFTFNCPNCQNDQNSNTFEYGFVDDFSGSNIPLSKTEQLYQKLPIPNSGNKLDLYVKVVDTLTGASTTTTKQVTITLPVVKSLTEIKKLTTSWNQIATLTPVGDYQRSVFNTATISRTMNLLIKTLSTTSKRNSCNGNGEMKDGKCVCKSGFTTSNCKWSIEDFEFIQTLISDLLNDFMSTSQIMTTSAESTSRVYITNLLFGLNSISQNVEYLSNQMVNSSVVLLRDAFASVQSSSTFVLPRGDLINLQNIMNLQEELMSAVSSDKLMETIDLLGKVLLRNVLVGQTAFKFETDKYLTVLNKHFKNEMNGMKLESAKVNITLPNDISTLLKTNSVKSPINYRWNVQKNTDEIVVIMNKRAGELITINSVVNKLILDPAPQTSFSKYLFEIEMKQYDSQATYICANIGSNTLETDCTISIKNSKLATCECSTLGYNLAILEYKSLETPYPSTSAPNKSVTTKKSTSNSLMWLLMLLVLIPLTALFISVIIWFVLKKLNKEDQQLQETSSSIELKHV